METHRSLALLRQVHVFAVIVALSAAVGGAEAGDLPGDAFEEEGQLGGLAPRFQSSIQGRVRSKLLEGSRLARHWIVRNPSCRGLFEELEADGCQALRQSIYVAARPGVETSICDRGTVAYTEVGSPVTRLCPGFGRLPGRHAAVILIHEALHFAGLGEEPMDPEGLTSDQITRLVIRECRVADRAGRTGHPARPPLLPAELRPRKCPGLCQP